MGRSPGNYGFSGGTMERFCEWCMKAKILIVEVFSLAGLIVVLGFAIYFEWHHLAGLVR